MGIKQLLEAFKKAETDSDYKEAYKKYINSHNGLTSTQKEVIIEAFELGFETAKIAICK